MLHILIEECDHLRLRITTIDFRSHISLYYAFCGLHGCIVIKDLSRTCRQGLAVVGIDHSYGDKRRFYFINKILVKRGAIAYLHTFQRSHLKQARLHVACVGEILVDLHTILVARLQVNKQVHLAIVHVMNNVLVGEIGDGAVFPIVDIIVIGIVVFHVVLHVVALLLRIALCRIARPNARNLLRDRHHGKQLGVKGAWGRALLAKHVTDEIGRDLAPLVVVMKLNAKLLLQRINHVRHRLGREILAIGIHTEDACAHLRSVDGCFCGDARHASNSNRLSGRRIALHINELAGPIGRVGETGVFHLLKRKGHGVIAYLLHALILRIFEFQIAATPTRVEPFVYILKKRIDVFLACDHLLKEAQLHIIGSLQSGFHGFIIFVILGAVIKRLYVVSALRCEKAQTVHVANGRKRRFVELHTEVFKEAIEEKQNVEADARLRTVGIQYPDRATVLIHFLVFRRISTALRCRLYHFIRCRSIFANVVMLITHPGVAIGFQGVRIRYIDVRGCDLGHLHVVAIGVSDGLV